MILERVLLVKMAEKKEVTNNVHTTKLDKALDKWADIVIKNNRLMLVVALVITLFSISPANKLTIVWGEDALFPLGHSTADERDDRRDRVGGTGLVVGLIDGGTLVNRKSFADDLAQKLEDLNTTRIEANKTPMLKYLLYKLPLPFFESRRLLYLSEKDLLHIEDRLKNRLEQERLKKNPFYINLETLEEPEIDISFKDLEERYGVQRFREYPLSEDGSVLAMIFKPYQKDDDPEFPEKFTSWIKLASEELLQSNNYPNISIEFGGKYTEQISNSKKLEKITWSAIILMTIVFSILVLLLFKRARPLVILIICSVVGGNWLKAIAYYMFGTINLFSSLAVPMTLTIFMSYGLLFFYGYSQNRKRNKGLEEAIRITIVKQGRFLIFSTLVTGISFFLLMVFNITDFYIFGILAGIGTFIMCIIVLSIMVPTIVAWEQVFTMAESSYVPIMNPMPRKLPRGKAIVGIGISISVIGTLVFLQVLFCRTNDETDEQKRNETCEKLVDYNYDFNFLQSNTAKAVRTREKFKSVFHISHDQPLYVFASSQKKLEEFMKDVKSASQKKGSMISLSSSIRTFLPDNQKAKKKILDRIDQLATEKNISFLDSNIQRKIEDVRPILHPPVITLYQLPLGVIRMFSQHPSGTEKLLELLARALSQLPDTISKTEWEVAVQQQINRLSDSQVTEILQNIKHADLPIYNSSNTDREALVKALEYYNEKYLNTVAYIYPRDNTLNGHVAVKLKKEIDAILKKHPSVTVFGGAIDLAETIEGVRENGFNYLILVVAVYIGLIILIMNKPFKGLITCLPLCAMFLWPLPAMAMFGISWNIFAFFIVPIVLGVMIDFAMRCYFQYWEDNQIGAVPALLKILPQILLRAAPLTISAISWMFSSRVSIVSMSSYVIIGVVLTGIASLTFQPAVLEKIHAGIKKW